MIVRTGARIIDHGPTPAPKKAKGSISGSVVVPDSTKFRDRKREREKKARYRAKSGNKA